MRTQHPYTMYDAIHAQPAAVEDSFVNNKSLSESISSATTVWLVGTGTSYHAAWSSMYIVREACPDKQVRAVQAIDFALYESDTKTDDLVIVFSHRGTKRYSLDSLKRAQKNGSKTALITGVNPEIETSVADLIVQTVEQEESSAHTVSYTASVAVMAKACGVKADLSGLLRPSLETEETVKELAASIDRRGKIWIVGAGPSEALAHEIALKIKETSYLQSEGCGTEELLHGPFQGAQPKDTLIVIAPHGKAQGRTIGVGLAADRIGVRKIVVGNAEHDDVVVPRTDEQLIPFTCLPPLQLLTYYIALEQGTNPDSFRLEDPKFKAAFEQNAM